MRPSFITVRRGTDKAAAATTRCAWRPVVATASFRACCPKAPVNIMPAQCLPAAKAGAGIQSRHARAGGHPAKAETGNPNPSCPRRRASKLVMPAQAGIQRSSCASCAKWIPACAGMTSLRNRPFRLCATSRLTRRPGRVVASASSGSASCAANSIPPSAAAVPALSPGPFGQSRATGRIEPSHPATGVDQVLPMSPSRVGGWACCAGRFRLSGKCLPRSGQAAASQ